MRAILIMLLAATFATAGTPDRSAWKAAWYRARRADSYTVPAGLVAYWSMDSRSTNNATVFDTVGSRDMSILGSPTFVSGKNADSINVGLGQQEYGQLAAALPNGTNYTFRVWVKPNKTAMNSNVTGGWILSDRLVTSSTDDFDLLYLKADSSYLFQVFGNPRTLSVNAASTNVLHNTWQHVVVVCDGSNGKIKLFVDGVKTEATLTFVPNDGNTTAFRIGASSWAVTGNFKFHGELDELAFWQRALTDAEVISDYNNGAGWFYAP